jgi:hypothetical protein
VLPSKHLTVRTLLIILVGTDGTGVMEVNIGDCFALDICVQSVHNGLEGCAVGVKFEDGMEVEVFINEDGGADTLDEVTAATTIMLSSFAEHGVCTFGEAVEVEVPELILIQFDFEQIVRAQGSVEVVDHASLHVLEFHNLFSFQMTTYSVRVRFEYTTLFKPYPRISLGRM